MTPAPLTPSDCDLRGLPFMPLDVVRLLDSDLFALATGEEFKAALALWCKAWLQVPAASLPDDDRVLAHLSGAGSRWKKLKTMALHRWVKCSDGRWYHPVIAEKAAEAWKHRQAQRERANKRWGNTDKQSSGNATAHTSASTTAHATASTAAMQGTGRGTVVPLDKSNGAEAPDSDQAFWANSKAFLAPETKGDPGKLIGAWCRDYGNQEVAQAITRAQLERPVQRIPFIVGCLKRARAEASDDPYHPAMPA